MGFQCSLSVVLFTTLCVFSSASGANNYHCEEPLMATLPMDSFKSSSRASDSHAPYFAKLNQRQGRGGWSPHDLDPEPWLQLDLRDRMEVTGIASQGRWGSSDWVSQYRLLYSDSGHTWRQYRQDDVLWTFAGNTEPQAVVTHKLPHSIRTRFLRIQPLAGSPSGGIGLRLEAYGCAYKSDVADFDGRSALLYRFNQKSTSTVKDVISLRFRSRQADGVLVHGEGQRGDYITLELQQGRLALHLNLDDAQPPLGGRQSLMTQGSLLDDHHWHAVLIERFNKHINFTVDQHTLHFRSQGQEDSLEVDYELSFGGIPLPGKPGMFLRENFHGCIENLYYNGVNVIDMAKRRKPQIYSVGNVTFICSESHAVAVTFLSSTDSFLALPVEFRTEGFSLRLQFRTWNQEGLLFSVPLSLPPGRRFLLLQLNKGHLLLSLHRTARPTAQVSIGVELSDGQWHSLAVEVKGTLMSLIMDNQKPVVVEINHHVNHLQRAIIFFGGCPASQMNVSCENWGPEFQGCLRLILINNQAVDLERVQREMQGNYSQLSFDACSIRDRCLPNFCEHGGQCSQSWGEFHCNCSGTGYTGATCHKSIYERSCEAYRTTGSPSGEFSIDLDGSGPLDHTLVNCTMTEDRVWTVVGHDHAQPVSVRGSTPRSPYILLFNYSVSPYHLRSLVASSQLCQQQVSYRCRKSRLFDTWDGTPLSWWLDRDGVKRTYWGGFLPGVQQCSCSLEGNCMDMNYFCNCDANQDTWANDTGLLSYKEHLPLSELAIGDTNRTNSEAVLQIGPLRCHGDRFFWNSASFYQESSYLHFPTMQAELSVDISLFFKTGSPSGVFLENLGPQDFIRLELSSPSVVTFTFDLGDGPVVLSVSSLVPLSDRQWHYVQAERNVKEASLQVDQLPPQLYKAPADGHYRLQLNSQLFVGGSASRQKGFLGCLRALTLNGVTLNLQDRAKTTPGVSSGCPGHCNSESVCDNGGRCVEKRSGYLCDCSQSAFDGPHCTTAISASFESGSSVTYTFQEPSSVRHNQDTQLSAGGAHEGPVKSRETVAFGFLTRQTPAMLLSAWSHSQPYMAVTLSRNGSLQLWYRVSEERSPDVFLLRSAHLADGKLHWVRISREGQEVYVQIDNASRQQFRVSPWSGVSPVIAVTLGKLQGSNIIDEEVALAGSRGFVGCLSSVWFNQATLLKAALQNAESSLVNISGSLVQSRCGGTSTANTLTTTHPTADDSAKVDQGKEHLKKPQQYESVLFGGVVAAVVSATLCALAMVIRFVYQHRRSAAPSAMTGKGHPPSLEQPYCPEQDLHKQGRDRKEYFI